MKRNAMKFLTMVFVFGLLLSACAPKASEEDSGTIAISGAFALYPMMTRWAEE